MTRLRRALLTGRGVLGAAAVAVVGALQLSHAEPSWAAWIDSAPVTGTTLAAHTVVPPASVSCTGGGVLAPLTYSWPGRDPRYTYQAQLVDSTGTVRRTDVIPDSGQSAYDVTYAADDLPDGAFTVRVTSYLTASPAWTSSTATSRAGTKTVLLATACG